ncbi:MAG: type I secretion system permease/ATPase [Acidobacteria bacterium]|nr:type I secretion system permease/ATPase [Acidobacteriota bacterium]
MSRGSHGGGAASGDGFGEIRAALSESHGLLVSCGVFSVFVNLLMLTGPLFMLQVYDRVLASRSAATLVTLVTIVAFLFLVMGTLDHARGLVMTRVGAALQTRLDARVLGAVLSRSVSAAERTSPSTGLRDLETMQRFASGTGPFAFFDAPWTPVFLFALFSFHWTIGVFAVLSGCLLFGIALLNQTRTQALQQEAGLAAAGAGHFAELVRAGGETVRGLGMQDAVVARSGRLRSVVLDKSLSASDRNGFYRSVTKTLRLFLQSMMLGLAAWLVILDTLTPGMMIASSILLGRALAPIDQAVGQWPMLQRAVAARHSLAALLAETPPEAKRTPLPVPRALLEAQVLTVVPPGTRVPVVRGASFRLEPGQAAGIAGPSASGKSTLARALAGVWPPVGGSIRLDGAELDQYHPSVLGHHIGYLPQEVVLFDGTVAENIARLDPEPNASAIIDAAKRTGAHEMILRLPGGYDFQVAAGGAALSGGQRQRIALARAFYGSPVVVVMDEPDSNLDSAGTMALAGAVKALKARGGAAVIVAHRPGAFAQCDTVYLMESGRPVPASAGKQKAPVRTLEPGARKRPARTDGGVPAGRPPKAEGAASRPRPAEPVRGEVGS